MDNLQQIMRDHALWLRADPAGKRADLSRANLSGANLCYANLSVANLRGANLCYANLSGAVIREGLTLGRNIGCASRGDPYVFWAFESSAGEPFIFAGCRAMLLSEYHAHIEREYPGTAKADATLACLSYLSSLKAI